MFSRKHDLVSAERALPGRSQPLSLSKTHYVSGRDMFEVPEGFDVVLFGMGCFWGAERKFWEIDEVHSTAVGYAGGHTPNPTYQEVCSGQTGHTEVVRVVFDSRQVAFSELLRVFWENHDPTQGMRQGADRGTQYRSAIYTMTPTQESAALASKAAYAQALQAAGHGPITTEVASSVPFYFAEEYHQQYLAKNPGGYCGIGGIGVSCPAAKY